MKIIAGLGNPGKKYFRTRHNIGFRVVDAIAEKANVRFSKKRTKIESADFVFQDESVVLLKPQGFMNLSGQAIASFLNGLGEVLPMDNLLVIYDEVYLGLGSLRFRGSGSSGGHNGIQSIIDAFGTDEIQRLRLGVRGNGFTDELSEYVLSDFLPEEEKMVEKVVQKAGEGSLQWVKKGMERVMNQFNTIENQEKS